MLTDDIAAFAVFRGSQQCARLRTRPVAYFCAEFAIRGDLPTYSGGLGVLAGDVIREAADRGVPLVGVGLYYNKGYICTLHENGGRFVEECHDHPPLSMGLEPVNDAQGNRVLVQVPLQDRRVTVQAWRARVLPTTPDGAEVPVYLLDTNLETNSAADRGICDRLYVGDKQVRLMQEIILGIGGLRLLESLGVHPSVYHLNEGHSAFLALELIHHQMTKRRLGFREALQFARRRVVFTNHTLVASGNEVYDADLIALMLGPYCQSLGIPIQRIVELGLVHESSSFSMTMLSLRMATIVNGVSKLHAVKAADVWPNHPMVGITNGVHLPSYDAFHGAPMDAPGALWHAHQERKTALLASLREHTGRSWDADALLLGWARRITRYKRPLAVVQDAIRISRIARDAQRPVRLIIAGQPHPNDADGMGMLHEIRDATEGVLSGFSVYLSDYDLDSAKSLVAGCDVWLNTPVIGFEASGTSGMKAAINGVLPCSTRDGWVDEVDLYGIGWIVNSDRIEEDFPGVLERDIVPMYYARATDGVPADWERHMRNARAMVHDRFSATRMLREYTELLYA